MASVTLTTYDEVLKTFYLPAIQEYLNHGTPLSDMVGRNEEDVSGKNATIEAHYGRSTGTGARADGGALPTANYQKFQTCTVPMKYIYGRIEVTGPTIAATRDERGSYARALDTEVMGITNDLAKEVNRMHWGCGWGMLARWRSTGSATSYTVQKKYRGNSAGGDAFGSGFGGKYLDKRGDAVPVVLASMSGSGTFTVDASDIACSAVTKTEVAYDTITVTDPSVTEAAGTFYVRPASLGTYAAAGAHRLEPMGLRGIVTDTDLDEIMMVDGSNSDGGGTNDPLQTLAVATYPWFAAIVDKHSSGRYAGQRSLTLTLMQTMFDIVEEIAGENYGPDSMWTTRALRREYLELCQADRLFVNTMKLDGGWKALDYNGVPLLVDNDAIDGEIYYLTLADLAIFQMSDYDWMEKDGAVLSRVSGYDKYEAILFKYEEFACHNRATQGVLADLAFEKSANEGYSY